MAPRMSKHLLPSRSPQPVGHRDAGVDELVLGVVQGAVDDNRRALGMSLASAATAADEPLVVPDYPLLPQKDVPGTAPVEILRTFAAHDKWIEALALSPNGQLMATAAGAEISLWDVSTCELQRALSGHDGRVQSLVFTPDSALLVSLSLCINVWEVATGRLQRTFAGGGRLGINCVAVAPDSRHVAVGSSDKTVKIWDATTGKLRQIFSGVGDGVDSVVFSADGRLVASGWCSKIMIWNMESGRLMQNLVEYSGCVRLIAFSPSGKLVAAHTRDGTLRVWDVETGEIRRRLRSRGWVRTLSFNANGSHLLSEYGPELSVESKEADVEARDHICSPLWLSQSKYRLHPGRPWVTFGSFRIRCLPLENDFTVATIWQFAPPSTATYVALRYRSGLVALIYFSDFRPSSPSRIWPLPQVALLDPEHRCRSRAEIVEFLALPR
ncbi:hypothetical protein PCL_12677 [Purpureocillium lilacinum]|uniref:Anaphase-promoting complex subunit 4-like WD40 domain-containing protein n=1 Tax=Purpureocillium lilacinum TaxID=33203 RepID=A0A2U3DPC4_PURLI|nr:hypothetical protein PCL_12677 [Purpureocillium lilacinum]